MLITEPYGGSVGPSDIKFGWSVGHLANSRDIKTKRLALNISLLLSITGRKQVEMFNPHHFH